MATLIGAAAIFGVDQLVTSVGIVVANSQIQNYDITRDSDKEVLTDENGEAVGEAYFNAKKTMNITVVPSNGLDLSDSVDAGDNLMTTPGTRVTFDVVAGQPAAIRSEHAGVWILQTARMNKTNRSFTTVDITLMQYDANNVGQATIA